MAIKAGSILHASGTTVIDRIQTGGAGSLNIPEEKIQELGNYKAVATVRDVPDLTFNLDVLDVDTEVEAMLVGSTNPSTDAAGTKYSLEQARPLDIISPWKPGETSPTSFQTVRGVATPHLTLESASYRYGLRENAGQQFSLRGDSIFYIPGVPYTATFTGDGAVTLFNFKDDRGVATGNLTAIAYSESGANIFALNVSVNGVRQVKGSDYTETAGGVTFTTAPPTGAVVKIVFGSTTVSTYPQTVHEGTTVKPAAIRGKDIQVYVGTTGATPVPFRWGDVQSVNVDWRITIEDDYEFGNPRAVAREATDVPTVSGTIELRPQTVESLFAKLQQITGVPGAEIIGPQSSVLLPLEIVLRNPGSGGAVGTDPANAAAWDEGDVVKTLYIPDARFTIPGYEGRVQQKLAPSLAFTSEQGILEVFRRGRPA